MALLGRAGRAGREGGRGGGGEADLVDVEILGASAPAEPSAVVPERAGEHRAPPAAERRRPSRRAWVALAVVGVLAAGAAVGVNVAEQRALEQRRADLAGLPGLVDGMLDRPVRLDWVLDRPWDWVLPAGDLVVLGARGQGRVAGVDPATGEQVWEYGTVTATGWCSVLVADPRFSYGLFMGDGLTGGYPPGTEATAVICEDEQELRSVELGTGTVAHTLPLQAPGSYTAFGGDVVAISGGTGAPEAVRWDPVTGEVRWSADVSRALPADDSEDGEYARGWGVQVIGDMIAVYSDSTLVLNSQDGSELPGERLESLSSLWLHVAEVLADGARVHAGFEADGDVVVAIHEATGEVRHTEPGEPLPLRLRDEGSAHLVLTRTPDGDLAALDARTGRRLWTRDDLWPDRALLAVDGAVLVVAEGKARSLDLETGATVWEEPVAFVAVEVVTDGMNVLLPARDDGSFVQVARRLTDGTEMWRAALPATSYQVAAVGSHVLVSTARGLEAWRVSPAR